VDPRAGLDDMEKWKWNVIVPDNRGTLWDLRFLWPVNMNISAFWHITPRILCWSACDDVSSETIYSVEFYEDRSVMNFKWFGGKRSWPNRGTIPEGLRKITKTSVGITGVPTEIWSQYPEVKQPGRESDHSPQTRVQVRKMWIYTSTPPYAIMAQCLVKHRDNFTFTFPSEYESIALSQSVRSVT
jgi:hypothetical protein